MICHSKILKLSEGPVSVVIKSFSDIDKLTDATRKVTITNDVTNYEGNYYFSREAFSSLSLYHSMKGVTELKCSGIFVNVDLFKRVLSFGVKHTIHTSNLKTLTIENIYGVGLFRIDSKVLTKNTFPNL